MSTAPPLLTLAAQAFSNLNNAENVLIQSAELGRIAILPEVIPGLDGTTPVVADTDYLIRAELLQWMCTDSRAIAHIASRGIDLIGGKLDDELNLSNANIAFPLRLNRCLIPKGIRLEYSTVSQLDLSGCKTGPVWAVWLTATKDIALGQGFESTGGVTLDRSRIAGDLFCEGGHFLNHKGPALSAHGSRIGGTVSLTENFRAIGETNFALSVITGSFISSAAKFEASPAAPAEADIRKPKALVANQIHVDGSVFLRQGVHTSGEVQFIAAKVGVDFDCNGAHFENPGERALSADRISIGSNAFFGRGFALEGIIWMSGANIEGDLDFTGAKFGGKGENGINLETITVKKTLFWQKVELNDTTKINLNDSTVGRYLDNEASWPKAGNLFLFGFKYGRIAGVSTARRRRDWLELQPPGNASLQPYQQLAAALREAGHDAQSKRVLIDKENKRYQQPGVNRITRLWSHVLRTTIGYGYAPRFALYWSLGVVLLGSLLFWSGNRQSLMSPVADGVYKDAAYLSSGTLPDGYQTFNAVIYSLDVFLPIVDLHQEATWQPNSSKRCFVGGADFACGSLLRYYFWIQIVIGWALTTLAVAGFSGLVRKD